MHKQLFNQAKIVLDISPATPLLIKSGMESADPSLPDMNFVRTARPDRGDVVYIPGSSLKGVLRSYSEKILRSLEKPCCNPMSKEPWSKNANGDKRFYGSCGMNSETPKNTDEEKAGEKIYKNYTCLACAIFGSTNMAARVRCTDGYPNGEIKTEKRTGVAIDRILGSAVPGALFDLEVVTTGKFRCEIFMVNFQLWQMGLIGLAIRDIDEGYVQLGFAKSRGLGRVGAKIKTIEIGYMKKPADGELWGVGKNDVLREDYGFLPDDYILTDIGPAGNGFRSTYKWENDSLFEAIVNENAPCWRAFLEQGGRS